MHVSEAFLSAPCKLLQDRVPQSIFIMHSFMHCFFKLDHIGGLSLGGLPSGWSVLRTVHHQAGPSQFSVSLHNIN